MAEYYRHSLKRSIKRGTEKSSVVLEPVDTNRENSINRKELHLLFIHLTKAYDTVTTTRLQDALAQSRINYTLIKAVKVRQNPKANVKVGKKLSKGFIITKGLRQGCCV